MKTLNEIKKAVHSLACEKGFYDKKETEDEYIEKMCNNLHDEISELHTAWRENKLHIPCDKLGCPLSFLEEELADIIIRVLDDASYLRVDILNAIIKKHEYNKTRSYRHGNKKS